MRCLVIPLTLTLVWPLVALARFDPALLQDDLLWAENQVEKARYEVVTRRRGAEALGEMALHLERTTAEPSAPAALRLTQRFTPRETGHADPPSVTHHWAPSTGVLLDVDLAGALLYSELPLRLRQLDWRRTTLFEYPLLSGLPEEGFLPLPAAFAVERIREGWRVTVKHGRDTDRLIFDPDYPYALNRWLRRDGYDWRRVELRRE